MKQCIALFLALCMGLCLASCGQKTGGPEGTENNQTTEIANPFVDYASLEEAASSAGFRLNAPDAVGGYSLRTIQVANEEMFQLIYANGSDTVTVRKIEGDADISGDYNAYSQERLEVIGDLSVTLRGDADLFKVATWQNKGFSYAVNADEALSLETISAFISAVK